MPRCALLNYKHSYHAGNHGDCLKHAILVWLVRALHRKPAAVFMLDTHAGSGRYDLDGNEARRTQEAESGILRLLAGTPPPPLADFVALVRAAGAYPGSPDLLRHLLRPQDRLACCELQPDEHAALRALLAGDRRIAVHRRDGWEALAGLLPPAERRALVLVDPPYEAPDDLDRLADGLATGLRRMPHAVFAAWLPLKHMAPVRALRSALEAAGLRDLVAVTLALRAPLDPGRLNGSVMLLANPPWGFEDAAAAIASALLARLGTGEAGEFAAVERWAAE